MATADGKVRVMIRLEGVAPPIEPPRYDLRAKRSDVRVAQDKTTLQRIATVQEQFLAKFEGGDNRRVTRFKHAPYLAMDLSVQDLTALGEWVRTVAPLSDERPFRLWIEPSDTLKVQSATALLGQVTIEETMQHMEFAGLTPSSSPATVVVIDSRVDEALHLLHGRVDAIETVRIGDPVEVPLKTIPNDPAIYSLSHGTKVALVVAQAAPNVRIIALDVANSNETSSTEYVANALERVLSKWAADPELEIAAVCLSLGDENMSTSSECDCASDPVYVGCAVLKPALRDYVNLLAAAQIPVVVAAGNHAPYAGEVFYPSCLSTAVTVGATTGGTGNSPVARADFSNWGPLVDLCASGHDLVLKLDGWMDPPTTRLPYSLGSGTSFAAPFVAASFALMYEQYPDATCALVQEALQQSGSPVSSEGVSVPELRVLSASKWLADPQLPVPGPGPTVSPTPPIDPTLVTPPSRPN